MAIVTQIKNQAGQYLSDLLQMPLQFDGNVIEGEASFKVELLPGLHLPVQLIAKAVFNGVQTGVLVKAVGHLQLVAAYNPSKQGLSVFLLDYALSKGVLSDMILPTDGLADIMPLIRPHIIKAFYNAPGKGWSPLKLPKE